VGDIAQVPGTATTSPDTDPKPRPAGTTGLIADLRRETTALLRDTLGEQRLRELRAQGDAMNTDEAVAYALDVITRTLPDAQSRTDGAAPPSVEGHDHQSAGLHSPRMQGGG
jgi:hypothetical protein